MEGGAFDLTKPMDDLRRFPLPIKVNLALREQAHVELYGLNE